MVLPQLSRIFSLLPRLSNSIVRTYIKKNTTTNETLAATSSFKCLSKSSILFLPCPSLLTLTCKQSKALELEEKQNLQCSKQPVIFTMHQDIINFNKVNLIDQFKTYRMHGLELNYTENVQLQEQR